MSEDTAGGTEHIDQSIPIEWHAYDLGERTLVARDVPEGTVECFLVSGRSRNVRTLAQADAVVYNGDVLSAYYDPETRTVDLVHDYGGCLETLTVAEWLDEPAVRLTKLPSTSLKAVMA